MKRWSIFVVMMILLAGCSAKAPQPVESQYADPRSLTHLSETSRLKIGMHESEVINILGPPESTEEGFYSGKRLWFKLYNPKHETIPTNFLVSVDRFGKVTFISNGS